MNLYDSHYCRIDVRFRQYTHDWMQMMLRFKDAGMASPKLIEQERGLGYKWKPWPTQRISIRFSSNTCPFPSLLSWLDAIIAGAHECSFIIDGEGPDAELKWARWRRIVITQPETCTGDDGKRTRYDREVSALVDPRQVVTAFYTGFRRYVESSEYDPSRYERDLTAREWLSWSVRRRMSSGELIGFLCGMDAAHAEFFAQWVGHMESSADKRLEIPWPMPARDSLQRVFRGVLTPLEIDEEIALHERRERPMVYRVLRPGWNRSDPARRAKWLNNLLRWPTGYVSGQNLRTLRSERIEAWLRDTARPAQVLDTRAKLFGGRWP